MATRTRLPFAITRSTHHDNVGDVPKQQAQPPEICLRPVPLDHSVGLPDGVRDLRQELVEGTDLRPLIRRRRPVILHVDHGENGTPADLSPLLRLRRNLDITCRAAAPAAAGNGAAGEARSAGEQRHVRGGARPASRGHTHRFVYPLGTPCRVNAACSGAMGHMKQTGGRQITRAESHQTATVRCSLQSSKPRSGERPSECRLWSASDTPST